MSPVRVQHWDHTEILLRPIRARLYYLANDVTIWIWLKDGTKITVTVRAGFIFDGRSGGWLVDALLPNLGCQRYCATILLHDALSHDVGLSFETMNELFLQMLIQVPVSQWRAKLAYKGVSIGDWYFGVSNEQERNNYSKISVLWGPYA